MLVESGFKSPILDDIRSEIWLKLWGSLAFNPLSALTHATLQDLGTFPHMRKLVENMMTEAEYIARQLDANFRVAMERRINGAVAVGKHKTR